VSRAAWTKAWTTAPYAVLPDDNVPGMFRVHGPDGIVGEYRMPQDEAEAWAEQLCTAAVAGFLYARLGLSKQYRDRVNAACAEIGREVGMRRGFYAKQVAARRMKQEDADRQIALLEDAAAMLRELSGVQR
jgi:hypothetical protein